MQGAGCRFGLTGRDLWHAAKVQGRKGPRQEKIHRSQRGPQPWHQSAGARRRWQHCPTAGKRAGCHSAGCRKRDSGRRMQPWHHSATQAGPNGHGCKRASGRIELPRLHTSPAGLPCSHLRQPALWQPASFLSHWAMCQRRWGSSPSQRCPCRDLLCSTAGQPTAPAGLAVTCGFFPAVDLSCLGLSQRDTGRLGVRLPVMPRTGTADWPEKARKTNDEKHGHEHFSSGTFVFVRAGCCVASAGSGGLDG